MGILSINMYLQVATDIYAIRRPRALSFPLLSQFSPPPHLSFSPPNPDLLCHHRHLSLLLTLSSSPSLLLSSSRHSALLSFSQLSSLLLLLLLLLQSLTQPRIFRRIPEALLGVKELQDRVAEAKDLNEELMRVDREIVDFHGEMVLLENYSVIIQVVIFIC